MEDNSQLFFHFDSDEDVFCVFSQYIDDLLVLARTIKRACQDEEVMLAYLGNKVLGKLGITEEN